MQKKLKPLWGLFLILAVLASCAISTGGDEKAVLLDTAKTGAGNGLTVHLKKPVDWQNADSPRIHYWNTADGSTSWPGLVMAAEGEDWYKYTFPTAETANIVFNNNSWPQSTDLVGITGSQKWCRRENGNWIWYDANPEAPAEPGITVHFRKPADWQNNDSPRIHYWNTTDGATSWPGLVMEAEDGGWYTYTFPTAQSVNIVFNNNSWPQTADLSRGSDGWFSDGVWYDSNPDAPREEGAFCWENAVIYQVMIDRFANGNPANDHAYGRELDRNGDPYPGWNEKQGTFHGGDLAGLTGKINDGYLTDLGITAIWITAPYEQIHGWIVGNEGYRFYGWAGYWPLDFTEVDANFGTFDDFKTFVDTAHANGIRVMLDVVMNHVGYITLKDMADFSFGAYSGDWMTYYYDQAENPGSPATYSTYMNFSQATSSAWSQWWSADWMRLSIDGEVYGTPLPGYNPFGPGTEGEDLYGLPDFRTESQATVTIPPILKTKWNAAKEASEAAEMAAFLAGTGKSATVRSYLVKWLSDWVTQLGIDAFRCDTAAHVELESWAELKDAAETRLGEWKDNNPESALDDLPFFMMGEGSDFNLDGPEFYENGFDAMLNFRYRYDERFVNALAYYPAIDDLYGEYASKEDSHPVSFISNHDYFLFFNGDMERQKRGISLLILTPKAVNLLYGDENARTLGPADWEEQQRLRSDMDFSGDSGVLSHATKLINFRKNHPAVGAGTHLRLATTPYTFSRVLGNDKVVCVLGASGTVSVNVSGIFTDGTVLSNYYTGETGTVSGGRVQFNAPPSGVLLIESL